LALVLGLPKGYFSTIAKIANLWRDTGVSDSMYKAATSRYGVDLAQRYTGSRPGRCLSGPCQYFRYITRHVVTQTVILLFAVICVPRPLAPVNVFQAAPRHSECAMTFFNSVRDVVCCFGCRDSVLFESCPSSVCDVLHLHDVAQ
jgi:hypothetical protein